MCFIRLMIVFDRITIFFLILNYFFYRIRFVLENRKVNNELLFYPYEERSILFLYKYNSLIRFSNI